MKTREPRTAAAEPDTESMSTVRIPLAVGEPDHVQMGVAAGGQGDAAHDARRTVDAVLGFVLPHEFAGSGLKAVERAVVRPDDDSAAVDVG